MQRLCPGGQTIRSTTSLISRHPVERLINKFLRLPPTHYSASYGTSQAAAFVGGLAAAMLSCYPDEYALSSRLKQRIQGTARPPFQTESAEKLAAGFVNAEMALRDPTVHWLSLANGEDPKEVAELLWCQQFAPLRKRSGHVDLVTATSIRQIARHVDSTWTFIQEYEPNRAEKRSGNIWRIGPGKISGGRASPSRSIQEWHRVCATETQ